IGLEPNEVGREFGKTFRPAFRISEHNLDVLTIDVAEFADALEKRLSARIAVWGAVDQDTEARPSGRLLCLNANRPRRSDTTEQSDELAAVEGRHGDLSIRPPCALSLQKCPDGELKCSEAGAMSALGHVTSATQSKAEFGCGALERPRSATLGHIAGFIVSRASRAFSMSAFLRRCCWVADINLRGIHLQVA